MCLNLAMVFERADEVILPAAYSFVARSFSATPSDLANITLARALVQAVCSPIGGILGGSQECLHCSCPRIACHMVSNAGRSHPSPFILWEPRLQ